MFIKDNKIKLMAITIILLIVCILIGALRQMEAAYEIRTIKGKIDIGGYGLLVNCYGKGKPTVVFDSGLRGSYKEWDRVQTEISKFTRTFSYNRAGLWGSGKGKLGSTSLNQVYELHTLLNNAKVKGPYIIVAHSIAGYNARLFAGIYQNEVAGIIFVDCSHENQNDDDMKHFSLKEVQNQFAGGEKTFDELLLSVKQVKEIRKKDSLRNIPITVLTADHQGSESYVGQYNTWLNFQNDITSLSNKSKHIFVKDSDHWIQISHPKVVIDAIRDMINEVRK
jgi:pimeloyl-ACP methyl ester carboxylesterase